VSPWEWPTFWPNVTTVIVWFVATVVLARFWRRS
jgi:hypothetical protein